LFSGQERFASMAPIFYRDAQAALVTFDVTERDTFGRAQWWINELRQKGPRDMIIVLVPHQIFHLPLVLSCVLPYLPSLPILMR
jgi:GTPase SAR1 family protein